MLCGHYPEINTVSIDLSLNQSSVRDVLKTNLGAELDVPSPRVDQKVLHQLVNADFSELWLCVVYLCGLTLRYSYTVGFYLNMFRKVPVRFFNNYDGPVQVPQTIMKCRTKTRSLP